jgi:hypothetical protein
MVLAGCMEDKFKLEKLSSDMEVSPTFSAPLARGLITLEDLVGEGGDNIVYDSSDAQGPFLKFVYREDSIFSYGGSDLFSINESGGDSYTLGNIELANFGPVNETISFRQIVNNATTKESEANVLKSADGSSVTFPEITESDSMAISGNYEADALDNFRYAIFESGKIHITVQNNMPVEISAEFLLKTKIMNAAGTDVEDSVSLKPFEYNNIAVGASETQTLDLQNKKLGAILYVRDLALSTPGSSSPVYIDLDQQNISLEAYSTDLVISSGEIAVTNQTLEDQKTKVSIGNTGQRHLDTIELSGGGLNYTINNNTNIPAVINITLPITQDVDTKNPVSINESIGAQSTLQSQLDLSHSQTIVKGLDSIPIEYTLELESTQDFVEYDAANNVDFSYGLGLSSNDVAYVSGYFGEDTVAFPADQFETGIDVFSNISGDFTLTDPSINLFYESSIGVPFAAKLDLIAESGDGTQQNLNEGGADGILEFSYPSSRHHVLEDTLVIDKNTSDVDRFISLPPQSISFAGEGYLNYNTTSGQHNFLTSENTVNVGMEMALPMELKTSGLTYRDSVPFEVDIDFDEKVKLFGKFLNEFPFGIDLQLICRDTTSNEELITLQAMDADGNPVKLLEAPEINESGRVTAPKENVVYFLIEGSDIELFNQTNQLVIIATIATSGTEGVKFYTDYTLDFRIGIDETGTQIDL